MTIMRTAAIVLAAGKSERMGRNKLLLKLGQKTLVESVIDALESSKIDEIVVVLGHNPKEITDVLRLRPDGVKAVINERYEEGMTSSFQSGLRQIMNVDAAFLVLGDEPILDHEFLDAMIEEMKKNLGRVLIISPIYRRKKGHPLLFHKELFDEILELKEPDVIRDVVHRHTDKLLTIRAPKWTVMDIDTPDDFTRIRKLIERQ
jgi:molybdenum cofactor cytidylyltransferase